MRTEQIPIQISPASEAMIAELAKLEGQTFQATLDKVVNEVLASELPKLSKTAFKYRCRALRAKHEARRGR